MKLHREGSTRRTRQGWAVLEPLEDRALLSAWSYSTTARHSWPDRFHVAAEIGSVEGVESRIRVAKAEERRVAPATMPRPTDNWNRVLQEQLAVDWNNWEGRVTFPPQSAGAGFSDLVPAELRFDSDAALDAQPGAEIVEITMNDPSDDGSSNDPTTDESSSSDWPGPIIKPNTRMGERLPNLNLRKPPLSSAFTSNSLVNTDIPESAPPGPLSRGSRPRSQLHHDPSVPDATPERGVVNEARTPARTDVLDGAGTFDWVMLERELRQFLSRAGGLSPSPDGLPGGTSVSFWIAIVAASFVAREAARGQVWRHRRRVSWEGPVTTSPESFPGPWPLGPL